MASRSFRVHSIIHAAGTAAFSVGAGMAQVPGSDAPALVLIQSGMILLIAAEYEAPMTEAQAISLISSFSAVAVGRGASQALVGWMPGVGNLINGTTAAAITEAVGWSAGSYFAGAN